MPNSSIISHTIPNLVGIQMYYIPPEVVDPLATPIYQNWESNIIIDEVGNRVQYDASTNPDNVLLYSWNMEYQEAQEVNYFYIQNEDSTSINVQHTNTNDSVYYRILPDKQWYLWSGNTQISLVTGSKCEVKRNSLNQFGRFSATGLYSVGGNIMSLIYGDDVLDKTTITTQQMFRQMFMSQSNIVSASELIMPATTLANQSYIMMFYGCSSLTEAPVLPATTIAASCYAYMFYGCSSLTTPPELPATTLAESCYSSMFEQCSSLITAPELPATTLAQNCYLNMFSDCSSLQTAPELPATQLVTGCYAGMFQYCSSLNYVKAMFTTVPGYPNTNYWLSSVSSTGTFVMNSAATWNPADYRGASGIPYNWTVQTASS